jgi:hypothetical protein
MIHSKQPSHALAFRSVAEQVPSDIRDHSRVNGCRGCHSGLPHNRALHHHIPPCPLRSLSTIGKMMSVVPYTLGRCQFAWT